MRVQFLLLVAVLLIVFSACGADNAVSVVDRIREGVSRLPSQTGSSLTVFFDPGGAPYTVIFFPDRDVNEAEAVAEGVDKPIARRIFTEMAYLGSLAGTLVVAQEGERLQFTSSWKQLPDVQPPKSLVVSPRKTGTAAIDLKREDGTIRVVAIR